MADLLILALIALILGLAGGYIYKEKKAGKRCIGCPDSGSCSGHCSGNCSNCPGCSGGKHH